MLKLTVLSPERKVLEDLSIDSVTLPGSEGQIQILPEHAAMLGTLETGPFEFEVGGKVRHGVISTGFFEVSEDKVRVAAETFEYSDEIDASRARSAQKKAEGALQDPQLDPKLFRKYELKLHRAIIRQQVAGHSH